MTVIAAGLGATIGFGQETSPGVPPSPVVGHFMPFLTEGLKGNKRTVESEALYGGLIPLASHRAVVGYEAKGPVSFELTNSRMGIFFQNMLGYVPIITSLGGTLYSQAYVLGNPVGMSMCCQVGRPDTGGNMHPFTYTGCKIVDWEITCAMGQIAKLNLTLDGMLEQGGSGAPAYVAPNYTDTLPFNFTEGQLLLGSTIPVGIVKNISIKGTWGLNVDRFQIGSTSKSEQLVDNWLKLNTTAEIEFANITDLYGIYESDAEQGLTLSFTAGPTDTPTAQLSITMFGTFADQGPPDVPGPAVITQKGAFTSLAPSSGLDAISLTYLTPDAAT